MITAFDDKPVAVLMAPTWMLTLHWTWGNLREVAAYGASWLLRIDSLWLPVLALYLAAQVPPAAPLRSGVAEPAVLDLRAEDGARLVPKDNRDAAQVEAARRHWAPLVAGLREAPAVRLRLGSVASPDDKLLFTDPQWADDVARAVYRAIASVYGSK